MKLVGTYSVMLCVPVGFFGGFVASTSSATVRAWSLNVPSRSLSLSKRLWCAKTEHQSSKYGQFFNTRKFHVIDYQYYKSLARCLQFVRQITISSNKQKIYSHEKVSFRKITQSICKQVYISQHNLAAFKQSTVVIPP